LSNYAYLLKVSTQVNGLILRRIRVETARLLDGTPEPFGQNYDVNSSKIGTYPHCVVVKFDECVEASIKDIRLNFDQAICYNDITVSIHTQY